MTFLWCFNVKRLKYLRRPTTLNLSRASDFLSVSVRYPAVHLTDFPSSTRRSWCVGLLLRPHLLERAAPSNSRVVTLLLQQLLSWYPGITRVPHQGIRRTCIQTIISSLASTPSKHDTFMNRIGPMCRYVYGLKQLPGLINLVIDSTGT
jgi:hypothetical protein